MRAIPQADAIGFAGGHIAEPAAQVTHNDIVRLDAKRRIAHAHAITRRTLAGHGEKRIRDGERALKRDGAGDAEEHEARAVSLARRTKTSRAGVIQVRNENDLSAATTGRVRAETFCSGEGGDIGREGA